MKKIFFLLLTSNLLFPFNIQVSHSNEFDSYYFLKIKNKEALRLMNQGNFSKAEKLCDEIIEISPEEELGYLCKGIALGFSGKRSKREALKNFTMAIEKNPEFYEAYYWRGVLQFSMRRNKSSKMDRTACSDIKKAYINNYPYAIDYVKKNMSFLRRDNCSGFY